MDDGLRTGRVRRARRRCEVRRARHRPDPCVDPQLVGPGRDGHPRRSFGRGLEARRGPPVGRPVDARLHRRDDAVRLDRDGDRVLGEVDALRRAPTGRRHARRTPRPPGRPGLRSGSRRHPAAAPPRRGRPSATPRPVGRRSARSGCRRPATRARRRVPAPPSDVRRRPGRGGFATTPSGRARPARRLRPTRRPQVASSPRSASATKRGRSTSYQCRSQPAANGVPTNAAVTSSCRVSQASSSGSGLGRAPKARCPRPRAATGRPADPGRRRPAPAADRPAPGSTASRRRHQSCNRRARSRVNALLASVRSPAIAGRVRAAPSRGSAWRRPVRAPATAPAPPVCSSTPVARSEPLADSDPAEVRRRRAAGAGHSRAPARRTGRRQRRSPLAPRRTTLPRARWNGTGGRRVARQRRLRPG